MGSKKVEELILMKEKRKRIEEFNEEHKELLLSVELATDPFERISVDGMPTLLIRIIKMMTCLRWVLLNV